MGAWGVWRKVRQILLWIGLTQPFSGGRCAGPGCSSLGDCSDPHQGLYPMLPFFEISQKGSSMRLCMGLLGSRHSQDQSWNWERR